MDEYQDTPDTENLSEAELEIEAIRLAASEGGENRVSFDLTFAQAASIRFRSQQLIREGRAHSGHKNQNKQIDNSW